VARLHTLMYIELPSPRSQASEHFLLSRDHSYHQYTFIREVRRRPPEVHVGGFSPTSASSKKIDRDMQVKLRPEYHRRRENHNVDTKLQETWICQTREYLRKKQCMFPSLRISSQLKEHTIQRS